MLKFLAKSWGVITFIWKYIKPIYSDLVSIIKQVKESGLKDDVARKMVFQRITDCIQAKGLEKFPDSVLNCAIELVYQIVVWKSGK